MLAGERDPIPDAGLRIDEGETRARRVVFRREARRRRVMGQPAPGIPTLMTGSSLAPCALLPNCAGLVRPTRV